VSTGSNTGNRRQEIIEQAAGLFARHGYAGASIRLIAGACDITEAAIYRYFAGKLDLYEEVIRHKAAEHDISGHLASHRGRGGIQDALLAVADHIIGLTGTDPDLMRLVVNTSLEGGDAAPVLFKEIRLPYVDFLQRELTERMASGEITPVDPLLTSRCFVGMVMDCALNLDIWESLQPQGRRPEDITLNSSRIIARGLTLDPQAASDDAACIPGRPS
jgi:AcrR family transcriptional regulator